MLTIFKNLLLLTSTLVLVTSRAQALPALEADFSPYLGRGTSSFGSDLKSAAGAGFAVYTDLHNTETISWQLGGRYHHALLYVQDNADGIADTLTSRHNIFALATRLSVPTPWLAQRAGLYSDLQLGFGRSELRRTLNAATSYQEDVYENVPGIFSRVEVGGKKSFADGLYLSLAVFLQRHKYQTSGPSSRYAETLNEDGGILNLFGENAAHSRSLPDDITESIYGLTLGFGYRI